MKNRILSLLQPTSPLFGLKSFFWIVFGVLLILPLFAFYPWKFRIVFIFLFVSFVILDLLFPLIATFFLASSGIVFGNHPGGRFLELQDCLWIFWCVRGIVENRLQGNRIFKDPFWKSPVGILLLLFFGAGVLSLAANPDLFLDFRFYRKGWFWFLHSTELEPAYPIKLLVLGILFLFGLIARKNWLGDNSGFSDVYRAFASGVAFGMIVSIGVGWLEYFLPAVKSTLNSYHRWLDGYKHIAATHFRISSLKRFLPKYGIQSLYWNRSWFSIHLISSLPFLFYLIFMKSKDDKTGIFQSSQVPDESSSEEKTSTRTREWVFLPAIFVVLVITFFGIGARGGMLSFLTFCAFSIFAIPFFFIKNRNTSRLFVAVFVSHFVVGGILFPLSVIWTRVGPVDPERFSHFSAGLTLGIEKLLLGGGFESYGWYNECCLSSNGKPSLYHTTHNQFLQIFSGLGIVGVILYSFLWGFLFYELLKSQRRKRSVLASCVFFSSVAAVFVYSFFQEWFYLRAVYFQWIALFPFFTESKVSYGFVSKTISNFGRKRIMISLCSILVLLLGSWFFFPTRKFRSGVYFPPGESKYTARILEGSGTLTLESTPELYFVKRDRETRDDLSISVFHRSRKKHSLEKEIHPIEIENSKGKFLTFRTLKGSNILKTECVLRRKEDPFATLNFWNRKPLDPEPRKICSQIRIRKKENLRVKKAVKKRIQKNV
ncbi:O-antigen ligase family protein [Leptospira alstonii]|uniref:O-antigen ligase family protein n=1 Tax=Leptospira alstonii TaxID=28452 RepID=UPI0007744F54|nr:O-antigen ligase family protein [Leptospira alstonii]